MSACVQRVYRNEKFKQQLEWWCKPIISAEVGGGGGQDLISGPDELVSRFYHTLPLYTHAHTDTCKSRSSNGDL